jgi:putative transposase
MPTLAKALSYLSNISLPLAANCHYKQTQYFSLLAAMSCMNWFAEGVSNEFRHSMPQADSLFHHLKKLKAGEIQGQLDAAIREGVKRARRLNLLSKSVWLAIDFTFDEYYGKPTSFCRGGKRKSGTNWFFAYATACIVQEGRRFTVAVLPFTPFDDAESVVERLLNECEALVRIKCVLFDRGFFSSKVIGLLEARHLRYVMPAVKNKKIKRIAEGMQYFPSTLQYELNGTQTRLVFVRAKSETLIFCTNLPCWRNKLTEHYSRRWGIETSYRVCDGFQAKTCSTSFVVRMFLFYFSIAFYNAWILANAGGVGIAKVTAFQLKLVFLRAAFCPQAKPPPSF